MRILLLLLLACCLIACENNEVVPDSLTGKWRLVSKEIYKDRKIEWENVQSADSIMLYFSKYGEVVNSAGFLTQCGPTSLKINGSIHKIKFHSDPANDPFLALCADCPTWNIELQGTEMILDKCSGNNKMKFIKE